MKIVIFAHMHPKEKPSGSGWLALLTARSLAREYGEQVWFLGGRRGGGKVLLELAHEEDNCREYVFDCGTGYFPRTQLDREVLFAVLRDFLEDADPDIIHFHSVHTLGLAMLDEARTARAGRVMTLHNYVPICPNNGWMMHTYDQGLCSDPSPQNCRACYPQHPQDLFAGHRKIALNYLCGLDALTTPSLFAHNLYVRWGVPPHKIRCLPNGVDMSPTPGRGARADGALHVGFFGQIGKHKGLDVVLRAMNLLLRDQDEATAIHLHIFGSGLENQDHTLSLLYDDVFSADYKETIFSLLRTVNKKVTLHGEYAHKDMPGLLAGMDCVVMPSIQWENQPYVIQEALACRVPVLASNIGGMAEMLRDGVDGLHFECGNPHDLREKLLFLLRRPQRLEELRANIRPQVSVAETAGRFLALYREVAGARK